MFMLFQQIRITNHLKSMAMAKKKEKKVFVLDTSVLLFDHRSIKNFAEHDVAIPITVLEEVDRFKKGNDVINFEAREFIRMLDELSQSNSLQDWLPINGPTKGKFKVQMNEKSKTDANHIFGEKKADHNILNATMQLAEERPDCTVVLVTKDINLRLKARSLNIKAEDYETGKVKDIDQLYKGNTTLNVPQSVITKIYTQGYCSLKDLKLKSAIANHFYILKNGDASALVYYNDETKQLERINKENAYGIKPRNVEQTFARPIVPLSNKDIGFLPGDIKAKINPYMEPLWDNLKLIQNQFKETDKEYQKIREMVDKEKLHITPLAYIRGRSLSNIIFIIDEAQNLTPHEVKTIITRAGENTKIIFTGDIFQIDTPYLDTHSNGLSYLIDKMKNHPLYAHMTLEKGERSELANVASLML
jgi:PhoH-like ATPase